MTVQTSFVCYIYDIMSRPKKNEQHLIQKRNELILATLSDSKFNQSDIATIFRLPRNTVSTIKKKYDGKKS